MPDWIMQLPMKITAPDEASAREDAEEIETLIMDEVLANSADADAMIEGKIPAFSLKPAP